MLCLEIIGMVVGAYAGIRLSGIAIEWLKEGLDALRPKNFKKAHKKNKDDDLDWMDI